MNGRAKQTAKNTSFSAIFLGALSDLCGKKTKRYAARKLRKRKATEVTETTEVEAK